LRRMPWPPTHRRDRRRRPNPVRHFRSRNPVPRDDGSQAVSGDRAGRRRPASHTYVRMKTTGAGPSAWTLDDTAPRHCQHAEVVALVSMLAHDDTVDGILVQHPCHPRSTNGRCSTRSPHPRTSTALPRRRLRRWRWAARGSRPAPRWHHVPTRRLHVDPAGQRAVVIAAAHPRQAGRDAVAGRDTR